MCIIAVILTLCLDAGYAELDTDAVYISRLKKEDHHEYANEIKGDHVIQK